MIAHNQIGEIMAQKLNYYSNNWGWGHPYGWGGYYGWAAVEGYRFRWRFGICAQVEHGLERRLRLGLECWLIELGEILGTDITLLGFLLWWWIIITLVIGVGKWLPRILGKTC